MSNQAQSPNVNANEGADFAESKIDRAISMGFAIGGAGMVVLAVLTAMDPVPIAALGKVAGILDRLGLDKGPLAMFGLVVSAAGFLMAQVGASRRGASAAMRTEMAVEETRCDVEGQSAILVSLQVEIGALRSEVAEARRELSESLEKVDGPDEASDGLFRLAASLDQLGARVDQRVNGAREETVLAVKEMGERLSAEANTEREEAMATQRDELAQVRAEIMGFRDLLAAMPPLAAETTAPEAAADGDIDMEEETMALEAAGAPLPRELDDQTSTLYGPLTFAEDGFDAEDTGASTHDAEGAVTPPGLEYPEPPAPLPQPSEGLKLIDEMQEDTARAVDQTPPLFPELDDQDGGH